MPEPRTANCVGCGTEFTPNAPHHKWCARRCASRRKYHQPAGPYPCDYCGEEFVISQGLLRDGGQHFCSAPCRNEANSDRVFAEYEEGRKVSSFWNPANRWATKRRAELDAATGAHSPPNG